MPWYIYSGFKEWCDPCDPIQGFFEGDGGKKTWTRWEIYVGKSPDNGDRKKLPPYDPWQQGPYDPWQQGDLVYGDPERHANSQYPIKKGPFKFGDKAVNGYDDCYYSHSDDDEAPDQELNPGELVCDGTFGRCVDDQKGRSRKRGRDGLEMAELSDFTWSPQVVCTMDGELPQAGDPILEEHPDPNCKDNKPCNGIDPDDNPPQDPTGIPGGGSFRRFVRSLIFGR